VFENLNNPVFVVGVILTAVVISIFLLKVFGSVLWSNIWRPKKTKNIDTKRFLSIFDRKQADNWQKNREKK
jgi:hypothetical protein